MPTAVAKIESRSIARPLKVLIPMIQGELQQGNNAGHEHYRRAGEMLIEAKDQVGYGGWGRWLSKNFDLSQVTAARYMRWAREHDSDHPVIEPRYTSIRDMTGDRERRREAQQSAQQKNFRRVLHEVAHHRRSDGRDWRDRAGSRDDQRRAGARAKRAQR